MLRIFLGPIGSGKTTLGLRLAAQNSIQFITDRPGKARIVDALIEFLKNPRYWRLALHFFSYGLGYAVARYELSLLISALAQERRGRQRDEAVLDFALPHFVVGVARHDSELKRLSKALLCSHYAVHFIEATSQVCAVRVARRGNSPRAQFSKEYCLQWHKQYSRNLHLIREGLELSWGEIRVVQNLVDEQYPALG